jgi:hypothetical protein
MTFFRATDGRQYPVSRIVSIGDVEERRVRGATHSTAVIDVEIEGGGTIEAFKGAVEDFLRQPASTFAAQPETYIVNLDDDEPEGYWKTLVIGWSSSLDGKLYPVTTEGVNALGPTNHYILTPDGRVSLADMAVWDSLEDLLEQVRKPAVAAE